METSSHNLYDEDEDDDDNDDPLHQKFRSLQKDWDSFKKSSEPLHLPRRRHWSYSNVKSTINMLELLDNSPRKLLSSLQHPTKRYSSSPFDGKEEWKVRDNDLAVLEIMRERMEVIESGQLKGRNLLEALENAAACDDQEMGGGGLSGGYYKEGKICSASSSVLIHGSEVTTSLGSSYSSSSSSSATATATANDDDDRDAGCFGYSSSGYAAEKEEEEKEKKKMEEEKDRDVCIGGGSVCGGKDGGGGKGMVVMAWVTILLMIFALGIILLQSYEDGFYDEDFEIMLKPT